MRFYEFNPQTKPIKPLTPPEARINKLEQDRSTTAARYQFDIERFRAIRSGSP